MYVCFTQVRSGHGVVHNVHFSVMHPNALFLSAYPEPLNFSIGSTLLCWDAHVSQCSKPATHPSTAWSNWTFTATEAYAIGDYLQNLRGGLVQQRVPATSVPQRFVSSPPKHLTTFNAIGKIGVSDFRCPCLALQVSCLPVLEVSHSRAAGLQAAFPYLELISFHLLNTWFCVLILSLSLAHLSADFFIVFLIISRSSFYIEHSPNAHFCQIFKKNYHDSNFTRPILFLLSGFCSVCVCLVRKYTGNLSRQTCLGWADLSVETAVIWQMKFKRKVV